ncbi:bacterial Ig-like domain-containing protein [Tamlana sp. 2_MG-2023]|nr:bacterial Ig-like domain-containing protein [Tamlana sp. 2_MG-2023]
MSTSDIDRVSMKTLPQLDYVLGNALNLSGMVITLDKGGDLIDVPFESFQSEGIITEPENGEILDLTDESVTISVSDSGKGLIQAINVTNEVVAMEIKEAPRTDYFYGEKLDLTDMVLTFSYENGDSEDLSYAEVQNDIETVPVNGEAISSDTDLTITHVTTGITVVQELNLSRFFPVSAVLVTPPTKTEYAVGEPLDLSGIVIRYTMSDSSEVNIGFEDFDALKIGSTPENGTILTADVVVVKIKHLRPTTLVSIPITVTP